MPVYSRREQVISALNRGKEQRRHYSQKPPAVPVGVYGTVAVILDGENYLVSITEVHDLPDAENHFDRGYDVDERHTVATLDAVEQLLASRLHLRLDDLEPARGIRTFRNGSWPPAE